MVLDPKSGRKLKFCPFLSHFEVKSGPFTSFAKPSTDPGGWPGRPVPAPQKKKKRRGGRGKGKKRGKESDIGLR